MSKYYNFKALVTRFKIKTPMKAYEALRAVFLLLSLTMDQNWSNITNLYVHET